MFAHKSKTEIQALILSFLLTSSLVLLALWLLQRFVGFSRIWRWIAPAPQLTSVDRLKPIANVPPGLASYGGSTTWAPIRKEIDPLIQQAFPKFQLRYTQPDRGAPSTGTGIAMLLRSQLDFAQASRPIEAKELQEAQSRGIQLKEIPVAIDGLAAIVHPNLPLQGVTTDQLDAIFAGKLTNWQQLGGPNLKIQPYGKQGRDQGPHYVLTNTTTEAVRKVSQDPGGIYLSSATLVVSQCGVKPLAIGKDKTNLIAPYIVPLVNPANCPTQRNQINTAVFRDNTYPMSRRLTVVIKQDGQFAQQAGDAYANVLLSPEGQELLAKAGFVNIR